MCTDRGECVVCFGLSVLSVCCVSAVSQGNAWLPIQASADPAVPSYHELPVGAGGHSVRQGECEKRVGKGGVCVCVCVWDGGG